MKCEIMTPIIHAFIIHLVNDDNVVCEQSYKKITPNFKIIKTMFMLIKYLCFWNNTKNENAFPVSHLLGQVSHTTLHMNELYI